MSGLVNKIKEAVHSDKHEQPSGTSGPHDSRAANQVDPRIDSDRDHRANPASNVGGTTGSNTYGSSATTGTTGTTGNTRLGGDNFTQSGTGVTGAPGGTSTFGSTGTTSTSTNRGPHDSNVANKLDPRFDSDRDNRAAPGGLAGSTGNTYGTTGTTGGEFGSSRTTGAGDFGSSDAGRTTRSGTEYGSATAGGLGSSNRGPHDSNLANKADPRVDSDRDHRGAPGGLSGSTGNTYGATGTTGGRTTGTSGLTGSTGTTGGHTTGTSGLTGTTGTSGLTGSTGPAPNTAGPHKSDALNKVDPRIDSDRDGSKTLGQDQTYSRSSNTSSAYKDPTDAAQVPPSVMAKHIGDPLVEHGDHGHERAHRNSSTTHQDAHRGL